MLDGSDRIGSDRMEVWCGGVDRILSIVINNSGDRQIETHTQRLRI